MIYIYSFLFAVITIGVSQILGLILALPIGLILEPILKKSVKNESKIKKIRYYYFIFFIGLTIGAIHGIGAYFYFENTVLIITFIIMLVFFSRPTQFNFEVLANGDEKKIEGTVWKKELMEFIPYMLSWSLIYWLLIGLYG